jgi:hypothetical protein
LWFFEAVIPVEGEAAFFYAFGEGCGFRGDNDVSFCVDTKNDVRCPLGGDVPAHGKEKRCL